MNLLYDGRIFHMQRAGGINRYFAEIISGLPKQDHPLITGVKDFGKNVPKHPGLELPHFNYFRPRRLSHLLREKWWKPRLLNRIDLFHPTYYDLTDGYTLEDFKMPMVMTAYDFIYARYPGLADDSEYVIRCQTEAILRADFVICISKATEDDLLERFPAKRGKTCVIHMGSSFANQPPVEDRSLFEKPAFLFVGGRGGYKNYFFLLRAFARACESNPHIRLRVTGAPLTTEERWQAHLLGISNRIESFVFPDEQQLIDLYRSSVALLYPSLHEGFGIPPLEAMACRTLPITSNAASLPEVMGDCGIMLDPTREEDWTDSILKVAKGDSEREMLIQRGLERVKIFSWKKTVDQHLAIYRQFAS